MWIFDLLLVLITLLWVRLKCSLKLLQGFDPGEDTYQVGDKPYLIL